MTESTVAVMLGDLRIRISDALAGPLVWVRALVPVAGWMVTGAVFVVLMAVASSDRGNEWPMALLGTLVAGSVLYRVGRRWGLAVGAAIAVAWMVSIAWAEQSGSVTGSLKVFVVVGAVTVVYDLTWGARAAAVRAAARARINNLPPGSRAWARLTAPVMDLGRTMVGAGAGSYGANKTPGHGVDGGKVASAVGVGLVAPVFLLVVASGGIWAIGFVAGVVTGLGVVGGLTTVLVSRLLVRVVMVSVLPALAGLRVTRAGTDDQYTNTGRSTNRGTSRGPVNVLDTMPALGDIPGLFAWLRAQGVPSYDARGEGGTFVGQVLMPRADGSTETAGYYDAPHNLLTIGTPGSGKTTKLLEPNILSHEGPVVAVSSAMDVATDTSPTRALMGECLFWDPSGASPIPEYTTAITWSPLTAINRPDDASRAAQLLIDAMKQTGGGIGGTEQHFNDRAVEILSALFFAATLSERHISDVYWWLSAGPTSPKWLEPIQLLEKARTEIIGEGTDPATVEVLLPEQIFLNTLNKEKASQEGPHPAESESAMGTATRMLKPYSTETARRLADTATTFNPALWERKAGGHPTIYIRTETGENTVRFGPVIALFVSALVKSRRDAGENVVGQVPLKMVFDEMAAVPIPSLGSILSNDRKYKIKVLAATQSDSQLAEHPLYGPALITGFDVKVLFPRSATSELHKKIEDASSRTRVWMASSGTSQAGDDFKNRVKDMMDPLHGTQGSSQTAGSSEAFSRALDRAEVVGALGPDEVRVVEGLRAITRTWEEVDPESGTVVGVDQPVKVLVASWRAEGSIWADVVAWSNASMEAQHRPVMTAEHLTPEDFVEGEPAVL